jgi:hypothetical protein
MDHPDAVEPPAGVAAFVHGQFSSTLFVRRGFLHFIRKEADRTALAPRFDSRRWGWLATADAPP